MTDNRDVPPATPDSVNVPREPETIELCAKLARDVFDDARASGNEGSQYQHGWEAASNRIENEIRNLEPAEHGEPVAWVAQKKGGNSNIHFAKADGWVVYPVLETYDGDCIANPDSPPPAPGMIMVSLDFIAQLRPAMKRYEQQAQQSLLACQKGGYPKHYEPLLAEEAKKQAALFDLLEAMLSARPIAEQGQNAAGERKQGETMKLPPDINTRMELNEAIVRDCAKIVAENNIISRSVGPLFNAGWSAANSADANAILQRYGLTEKEPK